MGSLVYMTGEPCCHGHVAERFTKTGGCRECNRLRSAERYTNSKDYYLEKQRAYQQQNRERIAKKRQERYQARKSEISVKHRETIESNPARYLWKAAKARAKRKGIPFQISVEEVSKLIPSDGLCPALGIPLRLEKVRASHHSMSLDRIVPELGYIPGNVVIISHLANTLKSDVTDPEVFRKIAAWLENVLK
jgi:hypothetical protein